MGSNGEDLQHLDEMAQLPRGRHGLPAEFIRRNQRARLLRGFTILAGEGGYDAVTIARTTEIAGVSTRTFYKFFATLEDCCVAAFEGELNALRPLLSEAFRSQPGWVLGVENALSVLLDHLASSPEVGRLLTVEPFVVGGRLARLHSEALEELVPPLRQGRSLSSEAASLPDCHERGILGAATVLIGRRIVGEEASRLPALLPHLAQFVFPPYVGAAAARQVV